MRAVCRTLIQLNTARKVRSGVYRLNSGQGYRNCFTNVCGQILLNGRMGPLNCGMNRPIIGAPMPVAQPAEELAPTPEAFQALVKGLTKVLTPAQREALRSELDNMQDS